MTYTESIEPKYCTVEDVAETLSLPSRTNPTDILRFSDVSNPSFERVQKMILGAENVIDGRARQSWRVNYVRNHVASIKTYWQDLSGMRIGYAVHGGDYVQLKKHILPWDPEKGDKLEIRFYGMNNWSDITDSGGMDNGGMFWFDYEMGKMYIRTRLYQPKVNSVRISYRWGTEDEEIPYDVQRLACLHVASQIINGGFYDIKVGLGGDIAGIKDAVLRNWQVEMGEIYSRIQRSGSVHSMLG